MSPARLRTLFRLAILFLIATALGQENSRPTQTKAPVDQLIPWLLDEQAQLRGIPFSEVIVDVTGKKVLPFDPKNEVDQRVVKGIAAACDETMKRLNAADNPIQKIGRITELDSRTWLRISEEQRRQSAALRLSRSAHCRSYEQARVLFRSETLRCW